MGNRISDTIIRIGYHIRSQDMNRYGSIHGGRLLTLADETGFLAAYRHAGQRCLTVGVHQAHFFRGAATGEQIEIEARVALTGHTSLWVPVRMWLAQGDQAPVMDAVYVFVAIDEHGRPEPVTGIAAHTEEEKALQARILAMRETFLGSRP
ncbi:MAG TPA: hotdog domain-containing protein [Mariprofundaceae bacterium]|nr:hotdog domain-containing protein [Mariprofundaceae bacterium]